MINSKLQTSQLKFRIPKSGTASLVFVMTLPTSREKTVCDSSIVTPAKYLVKFWSVSVCKWIEEAGSLVDRRCSSVPQFGPSVIGF